ncbi:MAG: esterase [Acidobacteria bacterium]|nr:esterase [Acidobacteriota bacterium]
MHKEHHSWHTDRLGRWMDLMTYGHYGLPFLVFPTSGGDHREHEGQSMIGALAEFIERGRIKIFTVESVNDQSFLNRDAHPLHRAWMQKQYDEYIRHEVIPFIHQHCRSPVPIATMGASIGAYHAANTLFKHPDVVKRCFALSGVYDMRRNMDGYYNDHFYFNNPPDYLANLSDPWFYGQLSTCDIHIVTGHGPWEVPSHSYELSALLSRKQIPHHLDDWGDLGGHDWPSWKHQMREYVGRLS